MMFGEAGFGEIPDRGFVHGVGVGVRGSRHRAYPQKNLVWYWNTASPVRAMA